MRLTGYLDTSHEASSVSLRQMLLNDDVEAAIYRTLISILNRYPAVSHDGALRDSIHRLVSRNPSYDDLVKGLACL